MGYALAIIIPSMKNRLSCPLSEDLLLHLLSIIVYLHAPELVAYTW